MKGVSNGSGSASVSSESSGGARTPAKELPSSVVITKAVFEANLSGRTFDSWDELVSLLPVSNDDDEHSLGYAREGAGESIVKLDPMHMFAWAATFCIQFSLWGFVYLATITNLFFGIACTVGYGFILWFIIIRGISPRMAGMLWPNLPCIVAVAGGLLAAAVRGCDWSHMSPSERVFFSLLFVLVPQTASAMWWMLGLPEDPDRAVLAVNVFVGCWAMAQAASVLLGWDSGRFAYGTLLLGGVIVICLALQLFLVPSRWGSSDLISWTVNVGSLAVLISLTPLFGSPFFDGLSSWAIYVLAVICIGVLGKAMHRTGPMLLSMFGLVAVCLRATCYVEEATGNPFASVATAALFGIGIIVFANHFCSTTPRSQLPWLLPLAPARGQHGEA